MSKIDIVKILLEKSINIDDDIDSYAPIDCRALISTYK